MFERFGASAIVVIAFLLSAPAKMEAQAVCSAPENDEYKPGLSLRSGEAQARHRHRHQAHAVKF